jgi:hypothetical protein
MKKVCFPAAICLAVLFVSGCGKPDKLTTVMSPTEGLFYTIETSFGHGAISSDYTRVYAHLERNGKAARILVIDGEYLESVRIIWISPNDVTLCLQPGSFTNSFRNQVTLIVGDTTNDSVTVHNHLQEHCDAASIPKGG